MEKGARFKYNLEFEYAMQNLFGVKHYSGLARLFGNPKFCKMCMRRAINRIKRRLDSVLTMDERLRETTGIILARLERNVKETSEKVNNDWEIIANLLDLTAHLLGYDWRDGKIHRHIVFYQDKEQEQQEWRKTNMRDFVDGIRLEDKQRYMLVFFLRKKGIPKYQIAELLGLTVHMVSKILLKIGEYEKETGQSFPEFE